MCYTECVLHKSSCERVSSLPPHHAHPHTTYTRGRVKAPLFSPHQGGQGGQGDGVSLFSFFSPSLLSLPSSLFSLPSLSFSLRLFLFVSLLRSSHLFARDLKCLVCPVVPRRTTVHRLFPPRSVGGGVLVSLLITAEERKRREKGRKGERERGREGERERGREGEREKGRKGEREKGRKGEKEKGRKGEREKERTEAYNVWKCTNSRRFLDATPRPSSPMCVLCAPPAPTLYKSWAFFTWSNKCVHAFTCFHMLSHERSQSLTP